MSDMHDIPGLTVEDHHLLSIGVLALCFKHVPDDLKRAIVEALNSAHEMGLNIKPENVTGIKP